MTNPFKKSKPRSSLEQQVGLLGNAGAGAASEQQPAAEPPKSRSLLDSLKEEQQQQRGLIRFYEEQANMRQQRVGELQSQIEWLERVTAVMQRYEQIEFIINSLRR